MSTDQTVPNHEYDLVDPYFYSDRKASGQVFAQLRRHDPVSWHPLPNGDGYWAVTRHADITRICLDAQTYSSASGISLVDDPTLGAMITTDPPRHFQMRKAVLDYFSPQTLTALEEWLRGECRSMIDDALAEGEVEFVFGVAAKLPLGVIGRLMEIDENECQEMLTHTEHLIRAANLGNHDELMIAGGNLAAFALKTAASRRGQNRTDLVSAMLSIDGKEQSDLEFATMFSQIAVAAAETTRSTLARIVYECARDPVLFAQMASTDRDLDAAVNEFLRYYTPVNYMRRTATCDHELAGQHVREGDKLVLFYPSANFDEDVFESPLDFDLNRTPNKHLTFGVGLHMCIGFRLARQELRVFLEEFFKTVSSAEIVSEPKIGFYTQTNAFQEIRLKLTPR